MYGQTYHCWKKKGHGVVDLRGAIIQSCDTYFYEMSRRLGVDRLKVTASRFGLGNKVFNNLSKITTKSEMKKMLDSKICHETFQRLKD